MSYSPYNIAQRLGLERADRVVVPKSGLEIVQHHAIYWGMDTNGNHWMMENKAGFGVKYTEINEFFSDVAKVTRIEKFKGNYWQRDQAIERGERYMGQPYNALSFNCEHFANIVQQNTDRSKQVARGVGIAALAALLIFGSRRS
jgi:hypothetical protein